MCARLDARKPTCSLPISRKKTPRTVTLLEDVGSHTGKDAYHPQGTHTVFLPSSSFGSIVHSCTRAVAGHAKDPAEAKSGRGLYLCVEAIEAVHSVAALRQSLPPDPRELQP